MPTVPKWLANTMEATFSSSHHPMVVTQIHSLDRQLKQVQFEGDLSKVKTAFTPGNKIEFV